MQGMKQERNWDRLIELGKKYNSGFHPMLSFDTVDKWFDTWNFFISKGVGCYLLEVRHPVTKEQMFEAVRQLVKIIKTSDKLGLKNTFNTTTPSIINRGMTCSAQTTLSINSDGCVYTCHRLMNERFKIADLNTKEIDVSKFVMWKGLYHRRNQIVCMGCPIKKICPGQCLGAVYEYWGYGGITIPIPSLCQYFLLKFYILSSLFDVWEKSMNGVNTTKLEQSVYGNFGKDIIEDFKETLKNV
jgi:radical SAM protein with 4Fe4S-binding SPASM domain